MRFAKPDRVHKKTVETQDSSEELLDGGGQWPSWDLWTSHGIPSVPWDNVTGWTVGFQVHYHGTCGRPLCTMGGWTV